MTRGQRALHRRAWLVVGLALLTGLTHALVSAWRYPVEPPPTAAGP